MTWGKAGYNKGDVFFTTETLRQGDRRRKSQPGETSTNVIPGRENTMTRNPVALVCHGEVRRTKTGHREPSPMRSDPGFYKSDKCCLSPFDKLRAGRLARAKAAPRPSVKLGTLSKRQGVEGQGYAR
ncbi:MAG: hypothetical protein RRA15_01525 [bacterium]|nr:hypothetical protein [bacterium]MDT8365159.1 hypothetical protein [bacterium]